MSYTNDDYILSEEDIQKQNKHYEEYLKSLDEEYFLSLDKDYDEYLKRIDEDAKETPDFVGYILDRNLSRETAEYLIDAAVEGLKSRTNKGELVYE